MKSWLHVQENSRIIHRHSSVPFCSIHNAAGSGGKANNLRRIACWKCAFQLLIQLKIEFSLFPLRNSLIWHYEFSIQLHRCDAARQGSGLAGLFISTFDVTAFSREPSDCP